MTDIQPTGLQPQDLDWLGVAVEEWSRTHGWALGGRSPTPALLQSRLSSGVLRQAVLRHAGDGRPAGLIQVGSHEPGAARADLGLVMDPRQAAVVAPLVRAFVGAALTEVPLRKLCLTVVDGELDVPSLFGAAAEPVGRLRQHERRGRRRWADLLLFELRSMSGGGR